MGVTYKPLTKKQRQELQGYVAPSTKIFRAVLFVVPVALLAVILREILARLAETYPVLQHAAWWVVPSLAFAAALYLMARRWTGGHELQAKIRADLKSGQLAMRRIVVLDAIEIEEQEDEGPGYFLLTDDRETMIFAGQYLEPFKRRGFPWKAFDILEAPESKLFIGLSAAGERLQPSFRRCPLTWDEAKAFGILNAKYRVVDRDFESLKRNPSDT